MERAVINYFAGDNKIGSNFYIKPILYNGIVFPSNENAFQYYKGVGTMNLESEFMRRFHEPVTKIVRGSEVTLPFYTPAQAKKFGKPAYMTLRPDWNDGVAENVMYDVNLIKYSDGPEKEWLLGTGDAVLIEGNHWHDNRWGKCMWVDKTHTSPCLKCANIDGLNLLGNILARIRDELRKGKV